MSKSSQLITMRVVTLDEKDQKIHQKDCKINPSTEIPKECDLYLMSSFPDKDIEAYRNSYILVGKRLRYITFLDEYEASDVPIKDIGKFLADIKSFDLSEQKIHLSLDQVGKLITSNGGHTLPNPTSIMVSDGKSYNFNWAFSKIPNHVKHDEKIFYFALKHMRMTKAAEPVHLILLIDVSGSMAVGRWLDKEYKKFAPDKNDGVLQAKAAVAQIINESQFGDTPVYFSVIVFDHETTVIINQKVFPNNVTEKQDLINEICQNVRFAHRRGLTDYDKAFQKIKDVYRKIKTKLLVLTDGGQEALDHASIFNGLYKTFEVQDVNELKKCLTIQIFQIPTTLDMSKPITGESEKEKAERLEKEEAETRVRRERLEYFSNQTGGRYFRINPEQKTSIPEFLSALASWATAYTPHIFAKSCSIYHQQEEIGSVDFEEMREVDTQLYSISIPNNLFANMSITLQLTNGVRIVLPNIPQFNLVDQPPIDYYEYHSRRRLGMINESKFESGIIKIAELYFLRVMLDVDCRSIHRHERIKLKEEKGGITDTIDKVEIAISDFSASRSNYLSEKLRKTQGLHTAALVQNRVLSSLQAKSEGGVVKKKPVYCEQEDEYKVFEPLNCYLITDIPFEAIDNKWEEVGCEKFAYFEIPPEKDDTVSDRWMMGVDPDQVVKKVETFSEFKEYKTYELISLVHKFFKQPDEKTDNTISDIFNSRKKIRPKTDYKNLILLFSAFLDARVGTSDHQALVLGILMNRSFLKNRKISCFNKVYQSHDFKGRRHSVIISDYDLSVKGDEKFNTKKILLCDPYYNQQFNLADLEQRILAITFYKTKDLDGILFKAFKFYGFPYVMNQVPHVPPFTEEIKRLCGKDGYNLICPLSKKVYREPVRIVSSQSSAWIKGQVYEKSDLENFRKDNGNIDPITQQKFPEGFRIELASDIISKVWLFYLDLAAVTPGFFIKQNDAQAQKKNLPSAAPDQPLGPYLLDETESKRSSRTDPAFFVPEEKKSEAIEQKLPLIKIQGDWEISFPVNIEVDEENENTVTFNHKRSDDGIKEVSVINNYLNTVAHSGKTLSMGRSLVIKDKALVKDYFALFVYDSKMLALKNKLIDLLTKEKFSEGNITEINKIFRQLKGTNPQPKKSKYLTEEALDRGPDRPSSISSSSSGYSSISSGHSSFAIRLSSQSEEKSVIHLPPRIEASKGTKNQDRIVFKFANDDAGYKAALKLQEQIRHLPHKYILGREWSICVQGSGTLIVNEIDKVKTLLTVLEYPKEMIPIKQRLIQLLDQDFTDQIMLEINDLFTQLIKCDRSSMKALPTSEPEVKEVTTLFSSLSKFSSSSSSSSSSVTEVFSFAAETSSTKPSLFHKETKKTVSKKITFPLEAEFFNNATNTIEFIFENSDQGIETAKLICNLLSNKQQKADVADVQMERLGNRIVFYKDTDINLIEGFFNLFKYYNDKSCISLKNIIVEKLRVSKDRNGVWHTLDTPYLQKKFETLKRYLNLVHNKNICETRDLHDVRYTPGLGS